MDTVQCASSAQARSLCCYHFSVFRIHSLCNLHIQSSGRWSTLCQPPHSALEGGGSLLCANSHIHSFGGGGGVSPVPFCKDEVWKGCRATQGPQGEPLGWASV